VKFQKRFESIQGCPAQVCSLTARNDFATDGRASKE
jgi:hypothetical protein